MKSWKNKKIREDAKKHSYRMVNTLKIVVSMEHGIASG